METTVRIEHVEKVYATVGIRVTDGGISDEGLIAHAIDKFQSAFDDAGYEAKEAHLVRLGDGALVRLELTKRISAETTVIS